MKILDLYTHTQTYSLQNKEEGIFMTITLPISINGYFLTTFSFCISFAISKHPSWL